MNKTKLIITLVLSLIFAAFITIKCEPCYTQTNNFTFCITQKTASNLLYKIWWAEHPNDSFSKQRSLLQKATAEQTLVCALLPTNKVAKFKIDIQAECTGPVELSKAFFHNGSCSYMVTNMKDFNVRAPHLLGFSKEKDKIIIPCGKHITSLEFRNGMHMESLNSTNYAFMLFTGVSSFLFSFWLLNTIWTNINQIRCYGSAVTSNKRRYLNYLSGVRGMAILLVVLFHLLPDYFPAGYLGVDIFFVISGYMLFMGHEENKPFNPINFIHKKVLRVVPLLTISVVIAILLVYPVIFTETTLQEIGSAAISTLLFHSNFDYIIKYSDYFATNANLNALLHTWYLSVLIQAYFIWAIFAFLLFRCPKIFRVCLILIFGVCSFAYAFSYEIQTLFEHWGLPVWGQTSATPYYHTFGRIWQLTAGGLLCILPELKCKKLSAVLAWCGFIALLFITLSDYFATPYNALLTIMSLVLLLWNVHSLHKVVFENHVLLWLGKLSFSLYLVHFPILVFYKRFTKCNPNILSASLMFVLIVGASYVIWKWVETRRFKFSHAMVLYAAALVVSYFCAEFKALGINPYKYSSIQYPVYAASTMDSSVERQLYRSFHRNQLFASKGTEALLRGNYDFSTRDTKHLMAISSITKYPEFVLLGDSTAQQMLAGFDTMCNRIKVPGVHLTTTVIPLHNRCFELPPPWYKWNKQKADALYSWLKAQTNMHTVVVGQVWQSRFLFSKYRSWDGKLHKFSPAENIRALRTFCETIKGMGKQVVLIAPTPIFKHLDVSGLEYMRWKERCGGGVQIQTRNAPLILTKELYYSEFKDVLSLFTQWENEGFCKILHVERGIFKHGDFPMYAKGQLFCRDYNHITPAGAIRIMQEMDDEFLQYINDGRSYINK